MKCRLFFTFLILFASISLQPVLAVGDQPTNPLIIENIQGWLACQEFGISSFNKKNDCALSDWQIQGIKKAKDRCEAAVAKPICQEMIKKDYNLQAGLRKCDAASVCEQNSYSLSNFKFSLKSCLDGYVLGTGEAIEGIKEGLYALSNLPGKVVKSFQKGITDTKKHQEFLRQCTTKECKLQVARDINPAIEIRQFPQLENEILSSDKYTAAWVEMRRQELESVYLHQQMMRPPSTLYDRATAMEAYQERIKDIPSAAETDIFQSALDLIYNKVDGLECFDYATQINLVCWGAAYIVDPTIVAGAAIKGVALARTVENTAVKTLTTRQFQKVSPHLLQTVGTPVGEVALKGLPDSLKVLKVKSATGETITALERAVVTPSGEVKRTIRELPLDPMTGTFDANFPMGRTFLEELIQGSKGDVTLAVIDIDNLGFVSKNFTHGFKGSPAEMKARSMKIGDQYIQSVAKALKETVGEQGHIFRTGGDEFAIVLLEKDPQKAKAILDRIAQRVHDKDVREIFTKESAARADEFRKVQSGAKPDPQTAQSYRLNYAPYSQPNVSIGAVSVQGESIESAFQLAERAATQHKVTTKNQYAADTSKYGGAPPTPDTVPRLKHITPVSTPVAGKPFSETQTVVPTLTDKTTLISETRIEEVFRVGEYSITRYQNELGETLLRGERYFFNPENTRTFIAPELFLNTKTGLIDGKHARTREILEAFTAKSKSSNRGVVWVNAENLGLANNFAAGGMATGDQLLHRTATILKEVADQTKIPVKMEGSEFLVLTEKMPEKELRKFTQTLESRLKTDAEISGIYRDQENYLRNQLKTAKSQVSTLDNQAVKAAQGALDKFLTAKKQLFSIYASPVRGTEKLKDVLQRTRGQRYTD